MVNGTGGIDAKGYFTVALEQVEGTHLVECFTIGTRLDVEVAVAAARLSAVSEYMRSTCRRAATFYYSMSPSILALWQDSVVLFTCSLAMMFWR